MKTIKFLRLTVLPALAMAVFLCVSSAMAEETAFCKVDEETCSAGNTLSHVHRETLAGNPAIFLSSIGNLLCNLLFLGDESGSFPVVKLDGTFTFSGCVRHKNKTETEKCTVAEINGPAETKASREGHETATETLEFEFNIKCGLFINCTYNGEGLSATDKGPLLSSEETGEISLFNQALQKVGSGICPQTDEWDLRLHPLVSTYITR